MTIYTPLKQKYPDHKIGSPAFYTLRPKWCVLPGVSTTQCMYVQILSESETKIESSFTDYKRLARFTCL